MFIELLLELSSLELPGLGEEHGHSDVCATLLHLFTELVRSPARSADVIDDEDSLALEEVGIYPHIVLRYMLTADVTLLPLADDLDMVEAVNGTRLGAKRLRELAETTGICALTTCRDADDNRVLQVHERKSLAEKP